ncbi:MAG: hypothetical protein GYA24_09475 [Candidatus Lokiarchaeota archaeon]|nr:hypothetical protein [Candidatus Lokiarchaeota archaeon]
MDASNHPRRSAWRLGYAQLAVAIGIIIPQALTMQRSLKSPAISDFIGIGACWMALPILVSLAWFKWRDSRFTANGDAFCLSIGALLQSIMIIAWPATTMPGTLYFWLGDDLVTLSGGWIQSAIIGIAICLGIHAIVFLNQTSEDSSGNTSIYLALAIGAGIGLAGFGLFLATYWGWTMYLFPSIMAWLAVGFGRFLQIRRPSDATSMDAGPGLVNSKPAVPRDVDIASRLAGWAGAILAILPVLLLSMNFQRHRYAAGYWLPLLTIGMICTCVIIAFRFIVMPLMGSLKIKNMTASIPGFPGRTLGLVIALILDILIVYQLAEGEPGDSAVLLKSGGYLVMTCACVVSCLPALSSSLGRLADRASYAISPGKAFGRIYFSATLLAIIIVIFLFEGTSMIFSWQFGDDESWIVATITVALAGLFSGLAFSLDVHHLSRRQKEAGKKCT